ncbi:MAG: nitrophenyl compound nitroreductase subunit ArsF family protein [Thermoanaerobaculia bacterium]
MRAKTLITILLALFVVVAVGAIVMKSPAPAQAPGPVVSDPPVAEPTQAAATADPQTTTAIPEPSPPAIAQSRSADAVESKRADTPTRVEAAATPEKVTATVLPVQSEPAHVRKVVATYFHGNVRCTTCRKVEAYAKEAVEQGLQPQIAAGTVEFRAVNVEEAANAHFIQDFQLTNKSVVVTDELDGKVVRWAKLDEVWSLVGKPEAYHQYVQDAMRGYLEVR